MALSLGRPHFFAGSSARSPALGSGVLSTPAGISQLRTSSRAWLPELELVLPYGGHYMLAHDRASFLVPGLSAHCGVLRCGLTVLQLLLAIIAARSSSTGVDMLRAR